MKPLGLFEEASLKGQTEMNPCREANASLYKCWKDAGLWKHKWAEFIGNEKTET